MKDREPAIVYLPAEVKAQYQKQAEEEGISLSAILRRELLAAAKKKRG